jgi:hypothetical protein
MPAKAPFERGDIVEMTTDKQPRPAYIISQVDMEEMKAIIYEQGTGFVRRVPLTELRHRLTS